MRVLVTGSNGHLGFALVEALLADGRAVRAGVRSLDPRHTDRLRSLGDDVEIVKVDVNEPAQLEAALDDVHTLFHAAAVFTYVDRRRESEMLTTSVDGTETVFKAAAAAGVSRVVLTSSVVTLPQGAAGDPPVTEGDWRTDLRVPYYRAKTEGERRAWQLAGDLGLDMVAVLPGAITGPGFGRTTPTIDLIDCASRGFFRLGVPDANLPFVDVRDVAAAHVLAAWADVNGRFAVADVQPTYAELVETLRAVDPTIKPPRMVVPRALTRTLPLYDRVCHRVLKTPRVATPELVASVARGGRWNVSTERARTELGWSPQISFEQSLRDTLEALRALRRSAMVNDA